MIWHCFYACLCSIYTLSILFKFFINNKIISDFNFAGLCLLSAFSHFIYFFFWVIFHTIDDAAKIM